MKRQDYCTSSSFLPRILPPFLSSLLSFSSFLPFFCPSSLPYLRISHLPLDSRSISLSIIITICYSSSISPPRAIRPLPQAPTPSRYLTRLSLVLYPLNTSHYPLPLPASALPRISPSSSSVISRRPLPRRPSAGALAEITWLLSARVFAVPEE